MLNGSPGHGGTLALALTADRKRVRDALFVLEGGSETEDKQGAKVLRDPEDLRCWRGCWMRKRPSRTVSGRLRYWNRCE